MNITLLLGLSILMIYKPAGVFTLNQNTSGKEQQCRELILQYILTHEKSQFDPELTRDCIAFLTSEKLEHLEEYPVATVTYEKSTTKQVNLIMTQPESEKVPAALDKTLEDSEVTNTNIKSDHQVNYGRELSAEKLTHSFPSEDMKTIPQEDDDLIEIYPENIIQEWPAVVMSGKEINSWNEGPGTEATSNEDNAKEKYIQNDSLKTPVQENSKGTFESDKLEEPEKPRYPFLGKDYKPIPQKDNNLVDIYPEKPVAEWPAVLLTRKKRATQQPTKVTTTTKKDTNKNVSPGRPSWEQHTLKDDLELDERGKNRPQTRTQLMVFYFKRFMNWLKAMLGLGPRVIKV